MSERIFYVDLFDTYNSNFYWASAFAKMGAAHLYDCRLNMQGFVDRVRHYRPTHIHLGGSVKAERPVALDALRSVQKELGCTTSSFFGDRMYSEYSAALPSAVTLQFISSLGWVEWNRDRGVQNTRYMPCPTEPSVYYHIPAERVYDVVYVGWNTPESNYPDLFDAIHKRFGMTVAGPRWKGSGYHDLGPKFGREFAELCGQTKIMLSPVPDYANQLKGYWSNRVANALACRCFLIASYTPGMESVFENGKHLVWAKSHAEMIDLIAYYLPRAEERERIAVAGQKLITKTMTFQQSARSILAQCRESRDA